MKKPRFRIIWYNNGAALGEEFWNKTTGNIVWVDNLCFIVEMKS